MSTINGSLYRKIFDLIHAIDSFKIKTIGFTCDTIAELQRKNIDPSYYPEKARWSIAYTHPHFIDNIICFLEKLFLNRPRIRTLLLSNIYLTPQQKHDLFNSIHKSKSLWTISFNYIPIGDDGLIDLLKELNPNRICTIELSYCNITDKSFNTITDFINKCHSNRGISTFSIEDPMFTKQSAINYVIEQAAKHIVEEEDVFEEEEDFLEEEDMLTFDESPQETIEEEEENELHIANTEGPDECQHDTRDINDVIAENIQLRKKIEILRSMSNAVRYGENTFSVGPGAQRYHDHMVSITREFRKLQRKHH